MADLFIAQAGCHSRIFNAQLGYVDFEILPRDKTGPLGSNDCTVKGVQRLDCETGLTTALLTLSALSVEPGEYQLSYTHWQILLRLQPTVSKSKLSTTATFHTQIADKKHQMMCQTCSHPTPTRQVQAGEAVVWRSSPTRAQGGKG